MSLVLWHRNALWEYVHYYLRALTAVVISIKSFICSSTNPFTLYSWWQSQLLFWSEICKELKSYAFSKNMTRIGKGFEYTMRTNLPKTLDLLMFSIYSLNLSLVYQNYYNLVTIYQKLVYSYHPKGVKHYILKVVTI